MLSLVPRLFGALVGLAERAQASDDRRTIGLAQAMFGRLQQTLVARDEMHRALNRPQNSDVAFEALTAFDLAVLTLMGAVDASARLVPAYSTSMARTAALAGNGPTGANW